MTTTVQVTSSYMKQLVKISWPYAGWGGKVYHLDEKKPFPQNEW